MTKAFIDTSTWISYSLSGQPRHSEVKSLIKQLIKNHVTICTSNDIVDETTTRLTFDTNIKIAERFINLIKSGVKSHNLVQLWVDEDIQTEAFDLVQKFSDHKLSLTDATSVILVKRFNIESIISLDSDFTKVGLRVLP